MRSKATLSRTQHATYELSFHQEGDYTFQDATVYAAIVELLLELEGVDPEPDFWARSIRGPWHIAVNEDCAQQFKERYGDITTLRIAQTDVSVRIKVDSIDEKIKTRKAPLLAKPSTTPSKTSRRT